MWPVQWVKTARLEICMKVGSLLSHKWQSSAARLIKLWLLSHLKDCPKPAERSSIGTSALQEHGGPGTFSISLWITLPVTGYEKACLTLGLFLQYSFGETCLGLRLANSCGFLVIGEQRGQHSSCRVSHSSCISYMTIVDKVQIYSHFLHMVLL